MKLLELFTEHADSGAGCLIMAEATKRFLLGQRSKISSQPNTWNILGGKAEEGETPKVTARREVKEEAGIHLPEEMIPLYVFRKPDFIYHNFLVAIPDEVSPPVDAEHQDFGWFKFGDWPQPLHFGIRALLDDPRSHRIILSTIG